MDAWSLVQCALSRRQQGHHQSVDHLWEAGEAGAVMRFGLAFLVAQGCGESSEAMAGRMNGL